MGQEPKAERFCWRKLQPACNQHSLRHPARNHGISGRFVAKPTLISHAHSHAHTHSLTHSHTHSYNLQDDLNDILEPPSPDSTTSMSFSLAQRLAVSCLDSPHLSPMSGVVPQSPQIPGALQGTKQAVPSRQRGGISLGGIPNAETWMSGGWEPQPPQPPPLQQQQMQQQMQQQIFGQGL